jgi:hypothetical protein
MTSPELKLHGFEYDSEQILRNKLWNARRSLIEIRNELEENKDLDIKALIELCRETLEETQ